MFVKETRNLSSEQIDKMFTNKKKKISEVDKSILINKAEVQTTEL